MPANGPRQHAQQRAAKAFQLRCMGRTWHNLAEQLGYKSRAAAYVAVRDHIARLPTEDRDTARAVSAGNYDALIEQLWQTLAQAKTAGDRPGIIAASRAIADIQNRHDQLLGVQAPTAVEVNVNLSAADAIAQTRARLHAALDERPRGVVITEDGEVIDYGSVKHRVEA